MHKLARRTLVFQKCTLSELGYNVSSNIFTKDEMHIFEFLSSRQIEWYVTHVRLLSFLGKKQIYSELHVSLWAYRKQSVPKICNLFIEFFLDNKYLSVKNTETLQYFRKGNSGYE